MHRQRIARQALPGDIWGITAYFNPANYANKKHHLSLFSERIRRQGLKLLVVELAFGESAHVLDESLADRIVRVRSHSVLWQKERLLNLALGYLPNSCDKVAWLDADIFFANDRWVNDLSASLENYVLVQPFEKAWWLSRASTTAMTDDVLNLPNELLTQWQADCDRSAPGVVSAQLQPVRAKLTDVFDSNFGHHGFSWAARRSILESCGLYDRCILGGTDSVFSWVVFGCFDGAQVRKVLGDDATEQTEDTLDRARRFIQCKKKMNERFTRAQSADITEWALRFDAALQGSVSFLPGDVYHLWHGDRKNRHYLSRLQILKRGDFDPRVDIGTNADGCWEWNTDKPALHRRVNQYFLDRDEESAAPCELEKSPVH